MADFPLTERFNDALLYASRLHEGQLRKGSGTPYIAHLIGVTALVLEEGGDEDLAIAALLHDAVEDQGGLPRLAEIQQRFGGRVAEIVAGCTDAYTNPKPPWRKRKEVYIDHLRTAPYEIRLVSLADKLYNARSILHDLRREGDLVWERFRGGKDGTLWYYHTLVQIFRYNHNSPMIAELERVVGEIEAMTFDDQHY